MTKFTLEQKLAAVQEYLQGESSQRSIAKKIGANHKSLQTWIAQYEANGVRG
jgi:transposase